MVNERGEESSGDQMVLRRDVLEDYSPFFSTFLLLSTWI
jgi:hypothetical protein